MYDFASPWLGILSEPKASISDYEICETIGGERLSIVGQLCLNNGTPCFQNRGVLWEFEENYENIHVPFTCEQSYSRIRMWSGAHVQELDIPRGCVCQEASKIPFDVSKPDECKYKLII